MTLDFSSFFQLEIWFVYSSKVLSQMIGHDFVGVMACHSGGSSQLESASQPFFPTCQVRVSRLYQSCFLLLLLLLQPRISTASSGSQWALPDLNSVRQISALADLNGGRQMSDRTPQRMPDRMSEYMSDRMPMSEYVSDRISVGGDHSKKVISSGVIPT